MAGLTKLLNGYIRDKSNQKIDLDDEKYEGKVIGLYFSAQWCRACVNFTPKLVKFYKKYADKKDFEIIFVSADNDEASFNEYYHEMPWLKFDFKQEKKIDKLKEKFDVSGYPTLVLLDADTGDVLCEDAIEYIDSEDPRGRDFPWTSDN
ncbi:unnamed protein product [Adineta steineri]|uniref:Thioredoxin domain-containing protein n=1 Tax=Adineta steineri TaxID=433720 RepID=A0A814MKC3_9BILA|nr:unnamed protein product [Adineta steineri]CAF1405967.1 unnamed protein product [Adineta steineri]